MISPEDILAKKFDKGRGYDKKEIDEYLQLLYENYRELYRRNIELQDQVNALNNGLQHYKTIETSLQKALILAEKTADETIQTAKLKADSIIREAQNNAAIFTADSHAELDAVHAKTIGLMQEYVRYKAQFNKLIQEQIELLNGSRFEIQTEDLLAFQKMNDESNAKTQEEASSQTEVYNEEASNLDESAYGNEVAASVIPEQPSTVSVFKGYKVSDEENMNQLDYLKATFDGSTD